MPTTAQDWPSCAWKRYEEARGVLEYAKNLYISMGTPEWAAKAQDQIERLP